VVRSLPYLLHLLVVSQRILSLSADQFVPTHVEPGHGRVLTKPDIQKRLNQAVATRAKIKDLVAQGKSLEEITIASAIKSRRGKE